MSIRVQRIPANLQVFPLPLNILVYLQKVIQLKHLWYRTLPWLLLPKSADCVSEVEISLYPDLTYSPSANPCETWLCKQFCKITCFDLYRARITVCREVKSTDFPTVFLSRRLPRRSINGISISGRITFCVSITLSGVKIYIAVNEMRTLPLAYLLPLFNFCRTGPPWNPPLSVGNALVPVGFLELWRPRLFLHNFHSWSPKQVIKCCRELSPVSIPGSRLLDFACCRVSVPTGMTHGRYCVPDTALFSEYRFSPLLPVSLLFGKSFKNPRDSC